ncbi:MAG: sugar phosphate isomerase/epimerase family protein [Acidobacteriaceae bacterium]
MGVLNRRSFVRATGATCLANMLHFSDAEDRHNASLPTAHMPRLGVVSKVGTNETADATIKRVHDLGFSNCQIFFEHLTLDDVNPLLKALSKYGVEVSAVSEHNPGPRVFNFYEGPLTVGIVPPANPNRRARIQALKLAADFARQCNIPSVHTHLGFIPENPNDPIYPQAIAAIREVAGYCKEQGRMLLAETGEDTPITMLRMIQDVGTDNIFVNLDTANLILCGKGNPVDAMDVFGHLVRGVHAKDGLFPTDPRNFGREVPIGQGRVDFPALFKRFKGVNYAGAITIEREIEGPRQTTDILQSQLFLQGLITKTYAE